MATRDIDSGLRTTAFITIGFGVLMLVLVPNGPNTVLDGALRLVLWSDQPTHVDQPAVTLLTAIIGGVALGWGVLVLGLAGPIGRSHRAELRKLVVRRFLAWFVAAGIGSILAGAPLNIVGNALFLAAVLLPLRGTRSPVSVH